jgi:ABC transport system ATP-binding/permease protein
VLLLDEPTNDLDLDTLRVLEDFLDNWPGAVVVVSHDRVFLDRVTDRIVACRDGRVEPVAGGLAAWIADISAPTTRAAARPGLVASAAKPARTAGAPGEPPHRRSATTVGFELRRLEKEMSRLSRERDRLVESLTAATDHQEMADAGSQLATVQAALEEVEDVWLAVAEEGESSR